VTLPQAPPADLDDALDNDLLALLAGHAALVFAAGKDDQFTPKRPAYPFFHHANVEVFLRVIKLAKMAGLQRKVVLGTYFALFKGNLTPTIKCVNAINFLAIASQQRLKLAS
jgi:nucleoside-diphosphate-sugar epimerase